MGALFTFTAFWVVLFAIMAAYHVTAYVARHIQESGIIGSVFFGILDFIDTVVSMTRIFFAVMFTYTKEISYQHYAKRRDARIYKTSR